MADDKHYRRGTPAENLRVIYARLSEHLSPAEKMEIIEAAEALESARPSLGTPAAMVDRFLSWPLPASVCSDGCATQQGYPHRTGTNLLTAPEAQAMLDHVAGPTIAAMQAKIDALMLEYCPDEMTPEQVENWKRHQVRVRRLK